MPKLSDFKSVQHSGIAVDPRPGAYYVTVMDADRVGFLLGPYTTHAAALANVERARAEAERVNSWAHFYGFGTVQLEKDVGPGLFNATIGMVKP